MSFQEAPDKYYVIRKVHTPPEIVELSRTGVFFPAMLPDDGAAGVSSVTNAL